MNIEINSFNSGEMSPLMQARHDTAKYANGCKKLENFIPRISGALVRRPGIQSILSGHDASAHIRIEALSFGDEGNVIMELGANYVRFVNPVSGAPIALPASGFFRDGDRLVLFNGLPVTHRETPWSENEIDALQFCQINNLIYITHPNHPVQRIRRVSSSHYHVEETVWDWPAMADTNIDNTKRLTYTAGNLVASSAMFSALDVGNFYEVAHPREAQSVEAVITAESPAETSQACTFLGLGTSNIAVQTSTPHGLVAGDEIRFSSTGNLPDGVEAEKPYYVVPSIYSSPATIFQFSETKSGARVSSRTLTVTANSSTNIFTALFDVPYEENEQIQFFTDTGTLPNTTAGGITINHPYYFRGLVDSKQFQISNGVNMLLDLTTAGSGSFWISRFLGSSSFTVFKKLPYPLALPAATVIETDSIPCFGRVNIFTFGAWEGKVELMENLTVLNTWTSKGDRNLSIQHIQPTQADLRLRVTASKSPPRNENETWGNDPRFVLESADSTVTALYQVTAYSSPTSVVASEYKAAPVNGESTNWAESAWSKKRGFPRSVTLHNQRLLFGGTAADPQTMWLSTVGDFQNFRRSTLDDAGMTLQIATVENNRIQWLANTSRGCVIGTSGDEWTLSGEGGIITPTSFQLKKQSAYGSRHMAALSVNDVLLFLQNGNRKIREHVYSFESDGYVAPDLTLLADHITRGGIRSMALMRNPDTIVWMVRNDGVLIGMSYERDQQIVAWHRHPTDGFVESVTVVKNDAFDELWLTVTRGEDTYIERMHMETLFANETQESTEGLVYYDGVDSSYESIAWVNSPVVPAQTGSSKGLQFRANRIMLHFHQTGAAMLSGNANESNTFATLNLRKEFDTSTTENVARSGFAEMAVNTRFGEMPEIAVKSVGEQPLNVLGIIIKGDFYGD